MASWFNKMSVIVYPPDLPSKLSPLEFTKYTAKNPKVITTGKKFIVLGFMKCGQNSVLEWLKSKHHTVILHERINEPDYIKEWEKSLSDYRPVIVVRDPVERCWSQYWYASWSEKMSYEDFLKHDFREREDNSDPIIISDYRRWIVPWLKHNPLIYMLEYLKTLKDFPYENSTTRKGIKYPKMIGKERELTKRFLKEEIKKNTYNLRE